VTSIFPHELDTHERVLLRREFESNVVVIFIRRSTRSRSNGSVNINGEHRRGKNVEQFGPQNVLRKIFRAGGFTTAMPSSCVCKYWREIGKPIARELNPVKMRIKRQLDLARKAANSYYSYDSSSESDKEEADGEALDEAKLKEKEVQSAKICHR
jgi:hypothetical protein